MGRRLPLLLALGLTGCAVFYPEKKFTSAIVEDNGSLKFTLTSPKDLGSSVSCDLFAVHSNEEGVATRLFVDTLYPSRVSLRTDGKSWIYEGTPDGKAILGYLNQRGIYEWKSTKEASEALLWPIRLINGFSYTLTEQRPLKETRTKHLGSAYFQFPKSSR